MDNTLFDFYNDPKKCEFKLSLDKCDIITDILINRSEQCNIEIFGVFRRLAEHADFLCQYEKDSSVFSREDKMVALYKYYFSFAVLIKYLYPLNEQLETLVDEVIEVRKVLP